ncbi:unnamed protein product [Fusarium equiseti]|uniref:Uncharacterized protein n=1 Tax=Fusarium equiseti TaxID=61235 RepID=A0A8J2IPW1_FUSEQ|nr:unnamed protein product [Fusarium equiseti]
MGLLHVSLLIAAVSQIGDVEYTDTFKDMFTAWTARYCRSMQPGEHEGWTSGLFSVRFSSSADDCKAPSSMPEKECVESFKKSLDACSIGAKISGGVCTWKGPDGTCLKFYIDAEKIDRMATDVEFHPEINEVDLGESLYSCDSYMKLFDKAKGNCLSVVCDVNKKECDNHSCVSIDGTTNQGVDDKFKGYLDQLRTVIAGSCKEEKYVDWHCSPDGICSNNKRIKVQIPSFIGSSTSKDGEIFAPNYKVTFNEKEQKSSCETVTSLVSAGIGNLPSGSLLGATSLLC